MFDEKEGKNEINGCKITDFEAEGDSRQFMKLLGDETQYASPNKLRHSPSVSDTIAHLKLLNAFNKLKQEIVVGIEDQATKEKLWQCFITAAVRKFCIFVSALKAKFNNDKKSSLHFFQFMDEILPSLDVILVWHSFLLNPRSIYDNFLTNDFKMFVDYPLPLYRINRAISNETMLYIPDEDIQNRFTLFMEDYLIKIDCNEKVSYNTYQPFDPMQIKWPVVCPMCYKILGIHQLTTLEQDGIADANFRLYNSSDCKCGFDSKIDYEKLRIRKLVADSRKTSIMPSIHRYFSPEITERTPQDSNMASLDENVKQFISTNVGPNSNLSQVIKEKAGASLARFSLLVLRDYFELNPIYLTIPGTASISIQGDLVACVSRQERFIAKMIEFKWLFSPFIGLTIDESIERYHNFFQLMRSSDHPIVPTLDIDLVWHTHQLSQPQYFEYSGRVTGHVVDHSDKIEEGRLSFSFEKTCKLYRQKFKKDYSICLCWYCSFNRKKLKSKFSRSKSGRPKVHNEKNISIGHISAHNAVKIDTERANSVSSFIANKYNITPDTGNYPPPWDEDYYYPENYVIDPKSPVSIDDDHLTLYRNGMCGTVLDPSSGCATGNSGKELGPYKGLISGGCVGSGAFAVSNSATVGPAMLYEGYSTYSGTPGAMAFCGAGATMGSAGVSSSGW